MIFFCQRPASCRVNARLGRSISITPSSNSEARAGVLIALVVERKLLAADETFHISTRT
jgi:hypothetical protein